MKLERTPNGQIELRLSENPDDFSRLASTVQKLLKGKWEKKVDGLDQSYWDLDVDGIILTVHREHYLGVSVFCAADRPQLCLLEKLKGSFEGGLPAK
jgi:hypothetical protein